MLKSNIFIPKTINVGYKERLGTYTGKLAYIIYYDENGTLRKEKSWNDWRDKKIQNNEFENVPLEGFVLNKKAGDCSNGWNHRRTYCRVYDPRGFEFEITIENLLYILENTNCIKGKGLEGKFIYGWDGKELVLMPVESPDYKEINEYNKLLHNNNYIKAKDLIVGATYLVKNNEQWIYIGRFETYGKGYSWTQNGETRVSKSYNAVPYKNSWYDYKIEYCYIDNAPYGKMYWFAKLEENGYGFKQFKTISKNKIIKCVDEKCVTQYSEIYEKMQSDYRFSPVDDSKDKLIDMSFEQFLEQATTNYDGIITYRDLVFIGKNANREYEKYNIRTTKELEGKYRAYKYSKNFICDGDKEILDIFPTEQEVITWLGIEETRIRMIPVSLKTIYETFKPVYKQKYLKNGREYKKEYIFYE